MIYLFYGTNQYRLHSDVTNITSSIAGEKGMNVSVIDKDITFGKIKNESEAMPFLSDKRAVIIYNIFALKDKSQLEKLVKWLPECPKETELVFVEVDSPDQRTSLYKKLKSLADVRVMADASPMQSIAFIKKEVAARGGSIDDQTASLLQLYAGNDFNRIEQEVAKLVAYEPRVTKENVDLLVDAGFFNNIFDFTDSIAHKNTKKALTILSKMSDAGESEIYIESMIAMQIRNLIMIKDLKSHSLSEQEIVGKTKLHPYVVKKSISQVANFTMEKLLKMHRNLLGVDIKLKTTSNDPKMLLEHFVVSSTI